MRVLRTFVYLGFGFLMLWVVINGHYEIIGWPPGAALLIIAVIPIGVPMIIFSGKAARVQWQSTEWFVYSFLGIIGLVITAVMDWFSGNVAIRWSIPMAVFIFSISGYSTVGILKMAGTIAMKSTPWWYSPMYKRMLQGTVDFDLPLAQEYAQKEEGLCIELLLNVGKHKGIQRVGKDDTY